MANVARMTEDTMIDPVQPNVTNPYEQNVTDYTPSLFEKLTQGVDTVAETTQDAERAAAAAEQRGARERSRYGVQLTPAEQAQSSRLSQLQSTASIAGATTQAIRSDEEINRGLTASALGLLSGEFQQTLSNLLQLNQINVSRQNAYQNARANSRSQHYGFLGSLGGMVGTLIGSKI